MGKGRGICVAVQHLRHAGLRRLLLITPVTSGQGVLETVGNRLVLDGKTEVELFVGFNALLKN